jgi:hypothetical protein
MTANCARLVGEGALLSFSKAFLGDAMRRATRLALWLITAMTLVLPAACTTHRAVPQKASVDPEWWLEPLKIVQDQYIDAIEKSCPPQGFLSNEKCARARVIESFARQNNAGTHCRTVDLSEGFLLCVEILTATERAYRALGLDPQSVMDWGDPFDSLARVSQAFATRLTSKCADPAQGDCVAQEIAATLAVSPSEANRCVLTSEVKRQVSCAMALIRIEGYKSALLYAG